VLLTLLLAVALAAIRLRDLLGVVMLFSIYSLLTAAVFMDLDAVDVAFTEAAVGAGVSTILLLASLRLVGRHEKPHRHNPLLPLLVVGVTGAALMYGMSDAPLFGDPGAPAQLHVAPEYLQQAPGATGVPNVVTAVLASYRGYDTLGETVVVFTAGLAVLLLIGIGAPAPRADFGSPGDRRVQRQVVKSLVPYILLFALYVQFHGDFGAGGGFQAGVIFAAGLVLYDMAFGQAPTRRVIPARHLLRLGALGVLIYGGVGFYSLFSGKAFLDYSALAPDPVHGQHLGILLVELGVGLAVFAVIMLIYLAFSSRRVHQ
jgi:multicomponent Na+:H+ antiporter subunit B